jgi:hypothetical protein
MRKSTLMLHLNKKIERVNEDREFYVKELDKAQRENLSSVASQAYGCRVDRLQGQLTGLRFALELLTRDGGQETAWRNS